MKKFLYIFLFLGITILTACQNEDDTKPVDPKVDNTVLMFMPWSGTDNNSGLYSEFLTNIDHIEKGIKDANGLKNTRLLIALSTSSNSITLFEIKYDTDKKTTSRVKVDTWEWPMNLTDFLKKVNKNVTTQNFSLIVAGHGVGWLPVTRTGQRARYFGGGESKYRFTTTELSDALFSVGMHPHYILFDACYMAAIENAYDLRYNCDYIISSTSELMDYGMPYDKMWNDLASTMPNYPNICNAFITFYNSFAYPYGCLSVIKTSEVESVASLMSEINVYLVNKKIDVEERVASLGVQKLDGYAQTIFFDLCDYINKIVDDDNLKQRFKNVISNLVISKVTTPKLFSTVDGRKYLIVNSFSGVTISDPSVSTYQDVISDKKRTKWWLDTH